MNLSSKRTKMESSSGSSEIMFALDAAKRARQEENVHKFKGVVPQQNGNWGAQIYANHQRIWLGTFKSEREAAMAYDSATIKLRSGECHRNFPWNDQTVQEPKFQSHYSAETVLSMIRDGTYPSNFATFLSTHQPQQSLAKHISLKGDEQFCCTQLFQKELTPSDVGKLNRLVIPKKHAVTYFPYANDESVDMEVVFYDKLMRLWKFRYCYWKSSQSYVFTRGWNRFVKDRKLKAKDVVAFFICEPMSWAKGEAFSMIDVVYNNNNAVDHERSQCFGESKKDTKQILGCEDEDEDEDEDENKNRDGNIGKDLNAQKGLRLFGVCIS